MIRFYRRRNETTSVPRDIRAPPALVHVFGQPAPTAFTTALTKCSAPPAVPQVKIMSTIANGYGIESQYHPAYPPFGYGLPTQHYPYYPPNVYGPPHAFPPHGFGYGSGYGDGYGIPTQYHPQYPPHGYRPPTQHHASNPLKEYGIQSARSSPQPRKTTMPTSTSTTKTTEDTVPDANSDGDYNCDYNCEDNDETETKDISYGGGGDCNNAKKKAATKKEAAPNKKKAATKKKTTSKKQATSKKKKAPNKKKAAPNKIASKKKKAPNKKKAAPNKTAMATPRSNLLCLPRGKGKESEIPFLQREGRNFDAAARDCLSLPISKTEEWKEFLAYCRNHPHLDCPILPATLSKSLPKVRFIFCLHYPGDKHIDKMTADGLLWLTRNGYLGEICLRFLTSTINRMIYHTEDLQGDCRDSIAFTDINMCPAPNKCGGDHNHSALQALATDVLITTIKLCPNAKIVFFGKKPNQFAANSFLQRLQKEGLADRFPEEFRMGSNSFASSYGYLPHSQFFLMQLNTIDHTKDLFRFVAFVIHAIFGKDIRNTLLTMDEVGIQQIVPFANQAMIEARSQAHSDLMKVLWDDPNSVFNSEEFRAKLSKAIEALWANPKSVYNSEKYSEAISEGNKKRSWTSIGQRFKKTPGVSDMQPCQFCAQDYQFRQMQRHENRCPKNPNKR